MTLQKAIDIVSTHKLWLRNDLPPFAIEAYYGIEPSTITEAIDLLLETAKDVLRCEDDGK